MSLHEASADQCSHPPAPARAARIQLAYSTLGCPGEPLASVVERCHRFGLSAIELRSAEGEPIHAGVDPAAASRAAHLLREGGITILALTTRVRLLADQGDPVADGVRELDVAAAVGAPAIRVYAGAPNESAKRGAVGRERLTALCDAAVERGLRVLVETHDSHVRGADVGELLHGAPEAAGAIWDVLHPWRAGELPATTVAALGDRLAHVQIKDWSATSGLCLPGKGEVPLADALSALSGREGTTWLSLEWERAWHPELPPLDEALTRLHAWVEASAVGSS